ncbi:MAG: PorT family protein [Prevotellaceae bacterium]|jgi:opacity protein-like surface antigen|nr:PorT family protein [Prevotellaceae bacterium]
MKKIILILAALAITLSVNAQTKFGIKAGLNVSQFGGGTVNGEEASENFDASGMLIGFHAGGYVNFSFGSVIGLQPEVVFSLQGGKESAEEGGETSKTSLGFVNVPILLDIKPVPNLSILVGPQVGINVTKSMSIGDYSVSGSELATYLEESAMKINTIDIAAVLGVQYTIIGHLTLGARYNFGFTPAIGLIKEAKDAGLSITGGGNRVIQVSVGWSF